MFPWIRRPDQDPPSRYNIAPTQSVAVVPNRAEPQVDFFHWGLIPYWAKDPSIGNRSINARAETLASKPMFRNALIRRRCLIPADGFYEWKKNPDGTKTPVYIRLKSAKPFAFAGLWERWNSPGGSKVHSCTIITAEPNELMRDIHDRMPVILPEASYRRWLDPAEVDPSQIGKLLQSYPADEMQTVVVSRTVNNPRVDSPGCIEPAGESGEAASDAAGPRKTRVKQRNPAEPGLF